jgi:L-fuconolactonase
VIVDAQVHAYEADSPARPWVHQLPNLEPLELTGDQMVAAMDAAGVDGAIYVSPWINYRTDTSYAESVYLAHPDRFRLVAPIDPNLDGVAERVAEWSETPGAVGYRFLIFGKKPFEADLPGVAATVTGAARAGMPVNVHCWHHLPRFDELARTYPDTQFVLDHVGLPQPERPPAPDDPFADLDDVLALARHPNVAIKLTGACTYSHRPFPYDDLWEPIGRIIDAFGVDRTMWGTDWQRSTRFYTYEQAVSAFRDHWPLSPGDKEQLLGGTAMRIYRWDRYPG